TFYTTLSVAFTDASTLGFGQAISWIWDFGDSTSAVTGQNATHVFTTAGIFTITLTITTDYNVTSSTSQTINILSASGDEDNDGLFNLTELEIGTSIFNPDTDGDGIPDGWEFDNTLDPLVDDAHHDEDNDHLSNIDEFLYGTDPSNADSDGDGFQDGDEVLFGTDPRNMHRSPILYLTLIASATFFLIALMLLARKRQLRKVPSGRDD
nr:PKD domain-containing protein [Candidatus Sigynarchaeota archaeon]